MIEGQLDVGGRRFKLLHDHPEQKAIWAADFDAVAPGAVEEIVRWATPVIHFRRTATSDTEIGGQTIGGSNTTIVNTTITPGTATHARIVSAVRGFARFLARRRS